MNDRFMLEKGMIHFVFANKDKYYTDSMMCLNLQEKLYYDLRKKDYNLICFIKLEEDNYHIDFGNQTTAQAYKSCEQKKILPSVLRKIPSFGNKKKESEKQELYQNVDSEEKFVEQLFRMMRKECDKKAYVFSVEAFDKLKPYVDELLKIEKNNKSKYQNLILVQSPVEVESIASIISKEDSIYRTELCPEIRDILKNSQDVCLFEKMQEKMPYQMNYLNKLEKQTLKNLIHHVIFDRDMFVTERLTSADDYVTCIWYLYHSKKFRKWAKKECEGLERCFPINPLKLYSEIEKSMQNEYSYTILDKLIGKIKSLSEEESIHIKNEINKVLMLDDYEDRQQIYLFINSPIWNQICHLTYDFIEDEELRKVIGKQLEEIERKLLTVHVNKDCEFEKEKNMHMEGYLRHASEAHKNENQNRFKDAVEALHYVICECDQSELQDCLKCYDSILKLQKRIFEEWENVAELTRKMQKERKSRDTCDSKIQEMRKINPNITNYARQYSTLQDRISPEARQFCERYMEFTNQYNMLHNNIEQHIRVIKNKRLKIETWQATIKQLRELIRSCTQSGDSKEMKILYEEMKNLYEGMPERDSQMDYNDVKDFLKELQSADNLINENLVEDLTENEDLLMI